MSKIIHLYPNHDGSPSTVNGKVPPRRVRNKDLRTREYLTEKEVTSMMDAARKTGRQEDMGIVTPR